jgi:general secretion pathway protein G
VGIQVRGAHKKALVNAAKAQVSSFDTPLEMYQLDLGQYPTTEGGLEALRIAPTDLENPGKWGPDPYLTKNVPPDPWGRLYQYLSPGKVNTDTFDIWSLGPDGVDGSEDDIGNWDRTL